MPMGTRSEDEDCTEHDGGLTHVGFALAGDEGCIARARRYAADFLARLRDECGRDVSPYAVGTTQLVVSELVTNALKYAPGPVVMELRSTGARVEVVVGDSNPTLPSAQPTDPGRVGRHGLEIVRAVAQGLDIQRLRVGKRITALIALTGTPGPSPMEHPC
ncbi:ATP-binding protein [Streptomyces canus]|uniref:ATP-binding protein n=1 Tax=Streptomyces canus TaxID=58343 RepID=UPI00036A15FA|nr:ATP-binding protein [Streptomyces canus]